MKAFFQSFSSSSYSFPTKNKNKRRAKQGFVVKWKASPKRLAYDLHKVLGFYASWIVIFTALTGLMFAFDNFADFTY